MQIVSPSFSEINDENRRQKRHEYVRDYSWAIPNEEAIKKIREYAPIIEIGPGGGYWAHLISEDNTKIIAFDDESEKYQKKWFEVQNGGSEKIREYPEYTLFLCWPKYNSSMAFDCLKEYTGNILYMSVKKREWRVRKINFLKC